MYKIGKIPAELIMNNTRNHPSCRFLAAFQSAIAFQVIDQMTKGIIQ